MMKSRLFIQLALLSVALVAVIFLMRTLRPEHIETLFGSIGASSEPSRPFRLCRTRLHSITWPTQEKIEERIEGLNMTWEAHDPRAREISYLEMEKWLGKNCKLAAADLTDSNLEWKPFLQIVFVDQEKMLIESAGGDDYRVGVRTFHSRELTAAVADLRRLAQLPQAQ